VHSILGDAGESNREEPVLCHRRGSRALMEAWPLVVLPNIQSWKLAMANCRWALEVCVGSCARRS
jgi:hypothetical protein